MRGGRLKISAPSAIEADPMSNLPAALGIVDGWATTTVWTTITVLLPDCVVSIERELVGIGVTVVDEVVDVLEL